MLLSGSKLKSCCLCSSVKLLRFGLRLAKQALCVLISSTHKTRIRVIKRSLARYADSLNSSAGEKYLLKLYAQSVVRQC
jgi:hypothetical protein